MFKKKFRIQIENYEPINKTYDENSQIQYYLFGILIFKKDYIKTEKVFENNKIGFGK